MPLWAVAYAVLLAGSGAQCVWSARRGERPWWFGALDALTAVAWIIVVVAYYRPAFAAALGRLVLAPFGFALFWTLASAPFEAAWLKRDPELSERANEAANWIAITLAALFAAPAVTLGILLVQRVVRAAT